MSAEKAVGWKQTTLGSFVSIQRGHDLTWRERRKGNVPVIGSAGPNGFHDTALATGPGIVLGRSGASFGQAHYCEDDFWPHNTGLYVTDFHSNDPLFAYYLLSSIDFSRHNSGGAQQSLNRNFIGPLEIAVPNPPEQRAIAGALSDVDALLAGLDRLIAKKRDLKQAAMQQLLTGHTRLPGFRGQWQAALLGEIARIKTGSRNNEDKVEGGLYPFFVRSEVVERVNTYSYDCEAILVPGEGRIGDIFHYVNGRFDVHQRVYAITQFKPWISAKFIHLAMAMNFGEWAMQNTVKATVDSLRLPTFLNFEMKIPPTLAEQTAIATALSDMDAEIGRLEARRDKTRALKQAMMQELLTGRIRLI